MQKIIPHLWFDSEAEEAAQFYTSLFPGSATGRITHYGKEGYEIHGQPEGKVLTVEFKLAGYELIGLNGGPLFEFNPSVSFFVVCESEEEVNRLWEKLSEGGSVLMPLDRYDWSPRYGWVQDRFGLSWQLSLGKLEDVGQKITPTLMYVGKQAGRAEEALKLYTSIFKDSEVDGIFRYTGDEGPDKEGTVAHAQFSLTGEKFMVMDSAMEHHFAFNEAISLLVNCRSQEEVDYFWEKLTEGGEEGSCGWVKDKFGVSWQVSPVRLSEMLADPDAAKVGRVTNAFLQMKKFDIQKLEAAYAGRP